MPGWDYIEVLITSSTGLMEHELCSHRGVGESLTVGRNAVATCGTTEELQGMITVATTDSAMSVKKVKFVYDQQQRYLEASFKYICVGNAFDNFLYKMLIRIKVLLLRSM